jgi:hypothetical protein
MIAHSSKPSCGPPYSVGMWVLSRPSEWARLIRGWGYDCVWRGGRVAGGAVAGQQDAVAEKGEKTEYLPSFDHSEPQRGGSLHD